MTGASSRALSAGLRGSVFWLTLAGSLLLSGPASARTGSLDTAFNIPSQSVESALLDVALQARVTLGGDLSACRGTTMAVRGRLSLNDALRRVVRGSGCGFVIRSDGAVIVSRVTGVTSSRPTSVVDPVPPVPAIADLGEVVVTGSRRPESLRTAPPSLTAILGDRIERRGAADLGDLEILIAGMTVTNLGPGRNKIFLRGVSDGAFTGQTQSTVGLYLDQVPITYNAPDPDLRLIDIDRVEVLRGPQGTLFGAGPIGGVVRMVTRRPDLTSTDLELATTLSRTRSAGDNRDYSVIGNLPLFQGRAAVRAAAYDETFSGYINDVELALRRVNEGRRYGGRLSGLVDLGSGWTVQVGGVSQTIQTEDTHYVYRGSGALRRANLVREPHTNLFNEGFVTTQGLQDWGRVDASVAWLDHRFDSRYDASSALPRFGSGARSGALDEGKRISMVVAEATMASNRRKGFQWLAGAFVSVGHVRSETILSVLRSTSEVRIYGETRKDDLLELALFGEASWDLTDVLRMTAGARVYGFDYSTDSSVVQRTVGRTFSGSGDASGLSPKLALSWRLNDIQSLFASVSQGYRVGGFNTAGPAGQRFTGAPGMPAREYAGDRLWNYEVGSRGFAWNGRVQYRASAYASRWIDIESDQFLPSGLGYVVNVGDGVDVGAEVEANWQVGDELKIRINALVADPRISRPDPDFNASADNGLPGVPGAAANASVEYRRSIWGQHRLTVTGDVSYVGPSYVTFDAEKRHRQGDYAKARVSVGLEGGGWSAIVFIDNVFDTEANTFAYSDPFRLTDSHAITPLRPTTAGVSLRWAFTDQ